MPSSYAQIPYGTSSTGISLQYGDSVPADGVNLAYVQATLPPVTDIVTIEDDLADPAKYAGNSNAAQVKTLQIKAGEIVDPTTGNLWTAPTDNVLFTTVTAPFTSVSGAVMQLPLFYSQRLRFPVTLTSLASSTQTALAGGLTAAMCAYAQSNLSELTTLVTITTESGAAVPAGYLWTVLPISLNDGQLGLQVFTNFQSSFKQRFIVTWGTYSETLNVAPVYFQHKTTPAPQVYLAKPVRDNSVGALTRSQAASGSSMAQIVSAGGQGSTAQPRSAPVADVETVTITSASSTSPNTQTIALTSETPYYTNGPAGFTVFPAPPVTYTTDSTIAAPRTNATALSLTLSNVTVQSDANGQGEVAVTLYDPNNIPVKSWAPVSVPTQFTFSDPNAIAGTYTWSINGTVNDFHGIQNQAPQGRYNYTVSWQGSHTWQVPVQTVYSNSSGKPAVFPTPAGTLAPSHANRLHLAITGIMTPTDPYGTTAYSVTLIDPTGTAVNTWNGITTQSDLYWPTTSSADTTPVGPAGSWVWSVVATCTNNQTGTSRYQCSLQANSTWYVNVPGAANLYNNQDGPKRSYTTGALTLAPTSVNTQLTLNLSTVTVQSDPNGHSSVKVQLVDPHGVVQQTWANLSGPVNLAYSNLAAAPGAWTWNVWTVCTNTGLGLSSYTDTWTGTQGWYEADPAASGSSQMQRTIAFTFAVGTLDGTLYATTDDGPQLFVQQPDGLDGLENWYLRMHRGWLNFTDTNQHTYLVGLEPYYSQNFDGLIPIVSLDRQRASVQSNNTIRLNNTPILVDPNYPLDVIVTRRFAGNGQDVWVTRDNGLSSGLYLPTALRDIDAAKGLVTLADFRLQSGDSVHVSYSYLEYYLVYRGFPDAFGRFVHLDVNPSGGHTWMNLWNIANQAGLKTAADTSLSTITSSLSNVATLVQHKQTITPGGTATITSSTQASAANVQFSAGVNESQALTLVASSATSDQAETLPLNNASIASIAANPNPILQPQGQTRPYALTGTYSLTATATPVQTLAPKSVSGVANTSTAQVVATNISTTNRVYTSWTNFTTAVNLTSVPQGSGYRHTWLYDPAQVVSATLEVDQLPIDQNSGITMELRNLVQTTTGGTVGIVPSEFPWNMHDHLNGVPIDGYGGNLPGPYFDVFCRLISPGNTLSPAGYVFAQHEISTLNDQSFNDYSAGLPAYVSAQPQMNYTGSYTFSLYPVANSGSSAWDDNLALGNVSWSLAGQYRLSSLQTQTSTSYAYPTGKTQTFATDTTTTAPVNAGTQLSLSLSNVVTYSDAAGHASYNVSLTAPNGTVVLVQSGITSAQTFVYSNPNASAGVYTWTLWASAAGTQQGSGTYPCSATVGYSWSDIVTSYTYSSTAGTLQQTYSTSSTALAPTVSGTEIFFQLGAGKLDGDAVGGSGVYVRLLNPRGQLLTYNLSTGGSDNGQNPLTGPVTLSYYDANATSGTYRWETTTTYVDATGDGAGTSARAQRDAQIYAQPNHQADYAVNCPVTLGWSESVTVLGYTYSNVSPTPIQYPTDATTKAPVDAGSQLQLQLTAVSAKSDTYGTSSLTVQLLNPSGQVVLSATNITGPTTQTYSAAGAPAGRYIWQLFAVAANNGTGTSHYNVTFSGNSTWTAHVTTTAYPDVSASNTFVTPASTLAPAASGTQLVMTITQATLPSDARGSCSYTVSLANPSGTTVYTAGNQTAPGTFTYSNAGAAAGSWTWTLTLLNHGTIANTKTATLTGKHTWYQSVTTNATVYTETDGTAQTYPVTATAAPSGADRPLTLNVNSISCFSDANGHGSFTVQLSNPASTIVKTWNVAQTGLLSYYDPAAASGTWTWSVTATCTRPNTGTGSYASSMSALLTWPQIDQVPTTFYTANPGPSYTYKTGLYTVAPKTTATQLTATVNEIVAPSDAFGSSSVNVQLFDPSNNVKQTWSNVTAGQTLSYSNSNAVSGQWSWVVYGSCTSKNNGTTQYADQWSIDLGWQEAEDDEAATNLLLTRALYLYLTIDGYPFHAVLDPLDDPTTPLVYDTNNALSGTRYAAMPTIHAF